jgi:hypothetical protein
MSTQLIPSERFKKNMIILLDIIKEMFDEGNENNVVDSDTKMITILKILIEATPGDYMINNFIKKTNTYWKRIKDKDIEYFKEYGLDFFTNVKENGINSLTNSETKKNNSFLKNLKETHITNFKSLLEGEYDIDGKRVEILDEERKQDIWNILNSFVRISISHIHMERNYIEGKYTQEYFPEINVNENIKEWNIKGIKF